MKRTLCFAMLGGLMAMQTAAAQPAAREAARAVRLAAGAPAGAALLPQDAITLRNFDPEADQFLWFIDRYTPIDSGFVFGTNFFGDRAKAVAFSLPEGITEAQVIDVNVWFAYKGDGLTDQTYRIQIFDGTAASGPTGSPRYSETFNLADIEADEDFDTLEGPTGHTLAQPFTVGTAFFVSVDFGTYTIADIGNASLLATDRLGQPVPEVWEQWNNESWHNVSEVWDFGRGFDTDGMHPWIEVLAETGTGTAVASPGELPGAIMLYPGYPNPFNPATTLQFALPAPAEVHLHVVDLLGRRLATLVEGPRAAGLHAVSFEAGNLPSGVYLARLRAGEVTQTRTLVLLR